MPVAAFWALTPFAPGRRQRCARGPGEGFRIWAVKHTLAPIDASADVQHSDGRLAGLRHDPRIAISPTGRLRK
jgi:hypothetical protein